MSLHDVGELCFPFSRRNVIRVEPVEESLSTVAGLLVLRQFAEQHQLTAGFAAQLDDPRRTPAHSTL